MEIFLQRMVSALISAGVPLTADILRAFDLAATLATLANLDANIGYNLRKTQFENKEISVASRKIVNCISYSARYQRVLFPRNLYVVMGSAIRSSITNTKSKNGIDEKKENSVRNLKK